jgi:chemotaxis protein MotB
VRPLSALSIIALSIIALSTLSLSGCVKKSTYEALQAQHEQAKARGAELEASLSEAREQVKGVSGERDDLAAQLKAKQRALTELMSDKASLKASVEEMEAAMRDQARRQAEVEARVASFKALINRFKPLIDTGKLEVKIVDGRMVLVLATDILFDKGSAELSEAGQASILEVAQALSELDPRQYQVEGHTDNDPISTKRYPSNWDLAADRALRVVKVMVEGGLNPQQLSGASYGEHRPVRPNESPEDKARNRRIEIVILPDLSSLPGFDELKRLSGEG